MTTEERNQLRWEGIREAMECLRGHQMAGFPLDEVITVLLRKSIEMAPEEQVAVEVEEGQAAWKEFAETAPIEEIRAAAKYLEMAQLRDEIKAAIYP